MACLREHFGKISHRAVRASRPRTAYKYNIYISCDQPLSFCKHFYLEQNELCGFTGVKDLNPVGCLDNGVAQEGKTYYLCERSL